MSSKIMTGKGGTDILLVGKTRHGKSATANTIVGYKAFQSKGSFESVTKTAQFEYGEFEGRILKVVDGPGIVDTELTAEGEGVKLVIDAMTVAVAVNPVGYHAIVVVAKYGNRFTKEEIEAIRLLKIIFGVDFIKNHGILLMTNGDGFAREEESEKLFEEWIRQEGGIVKYLIGECSGRVILFNNNDTDENRKKEQIRKLLGIIDQLATYGQRYTSDMFNKGKEARDQLLKASKELHLNEESLMECSLITQGLARINYDDPTNALHILHNLLPRTSQLKESLELQDQGTKQLSVPINLAKQQNESVNEGIKDASEVLKMKEQMKKMEAELEMARMRLETGEEKTKAEERKHQKEKERQMAREEELATKLKKMSEKKTKLMMEKEEVKKKKLEDIQNSHEAVKQEATWSWGSVAGSVAGAIASTIGGPIAGPLAGTAASLVKLWLGK